MKLQYRILWFDDNREIYESLDIDYLEGEISKWGFVPEIDLVVTAEEFASRSPFGGYDLLVVDYNLEGYGHGEDFIAQVRDQQVFTEVIFYSSGAAGLLWEAVHKKKLEGIYVANKDSILSRILKVGQQTLRKVLDLGNMRGIVMAEVGDLDLLLERILNSAINSLDAATQTKIFQRFYDAGAEHNATHLASLEKFIQAPTVEMMLSLCDSSKRWQNYRRALKHHPLLKRQVLGDYEVEILQPRNCLAHGIPQARADGSSVFLHQGKSYEFTDAVGTDLRTKIIKYKRAFSEIDEELMAARAAP